jgi:hypothetical protein
MRKLSWASTQIAASFGMALNFIKSISRVQENEPPTPPIKNEDYSCNSHRDSCQPNMTTA